MIMLFALIYILFNVFSRCKEKGYSMNNKYNSFLFLLLISCSCVWGVIQLLFVILNITPQPRHPMRTRAPKAQ